MANNSPTLTTGDDWRSRAGGLDPTYDRVRIQAEILAGLPNEQRRISDAFRHQAFFDHDGLRYMKRRSAEGEFDFRGRPHRDSGFLREVVEVLCSNLYCPGPNRMVQGSPQASEFLSHVYESTHIDDLMHEADVAATLNDVAAIQVKATNDPDRPIELEVWGAEEFHVFLDPDKATQPVAVVTIDRFDLQTRYRLWFDDVVETYVTQPYSYGKTAGSRVAELQAREPNTYGCLPFAFVHYARPVRYFWTSGVGAFICRAQMSIDNQLSDLRQAIQKYLFPLPILTGASPGINPDINPGQWVRLHGAGINYPGGEYGSGIQPELKYLQAQIDIAGAWEDITKYVDQTLQACRVPAVAARMDQTQVASGIQLIIEQAPLLTRARARRRSFQLYETTLARTILTCAGNHYDRPELLAAAASPQLSFAWPEPTIPIPGPDRDNADIFEVQAGFASRIEILMRRRGLSRDQALAEMARIADDERLASQILGPVHTAPTADPNKEPSLEEPPDDPPHE